MFCKECGALVFPKKVGDKKVVKCKCGYSSDKIGETKITQTIKHKEIEVIESDTEAHPVIESKCEKCSHNEAYFWTIQTRASDEPPTKFLKCVKCKHTIRDYG